MSEHTQLDDWLRNNGPASFEGDDFIGWLSQPALWGPDHLVIRWYPHRRRATLEFHGLRHVCRGLGWPMSDHERRDIADEVACGLGERFGGRWRINVTCRESALREDLTDG